MARIDEQVVQEIVLFPNRSKANDLIAKLCNVDHFARGRFVEVMQVERARVDPREGGSPRDKKQFLQSRSIGFFKGSDQQRREHTRERNAPAHAKEVCGLLERPTKRELFALDVEVANVESVLFNELAAGLYLFAHQHAEHIVSSTRITHADLDQRAILGVERRFAKLFRVHFA